MGTLTDIAIGMDNQRAADLRELNERIQETEALLSSQRQRRQELMGEPIAAAGGAEEPHFEPVELSTMNFTGELHDCNARLTEFRDEWDQQQRRLEEGFEQRLLQDATEPQREYSDTF